MLSIKDKKYSLKDFNQIFDLKIQSQIQKKGLQLADCYQIGMPTLKTIGENYGVENLFIWLENFVIDLNEFVGVKSKMTREQSEELSRLISYQYYFLNIVEINLFFIKIKSGFYGKFYGVVDAQLIMTFLNDFNNERIAEINRINAELKKIELKKSIEKWNKECITYEEYKKIKSQIL